MIEETITWDDPKFIRYEESCFYCFGNCDLCLIKFSCFTGNLNELKLPNPLNGIDANIELLAFDSVIGRIIYHADVRGGRFLRQPYHGFQLDSYVFKNSKLLYLNKNRMVCCKKRAKAVHHVKNWE